MRKLSARQEKDCDMGKSGMVQIYLNSIFDLILDYRLNVDLQEACNKDIMKYCKSIVETENDVEELHGQVITCLRIKFSQKVIG